MEWLYYLVGFLIIFFGGIYLIVWRDSRRNGNLDNFVDGLFWNPFRNLRSNVKDRQRTIKTQIERGRNRK